jgi:hypothetical protein
MINSITSKNGVLVRLPDERWLHIEYEHDDLRGLKGEVLHTIEKPDRILAGNENEMLAVREIEQGKWLVVVYKELSASDGFVITSFVTRRAKQLERRKQIWP